MRVKSKETHAAQTVSAYNIHRISDEKHSCSISFWGSFTSTFSRNIINIIDICIHVNLPEFISVTYENLRVRRILGVGGGTGWPLKTSNHSVSFYSLKDSQTSLLRRRRGRIHDACGDNRPRRLSLKFEIRKLESSKLENSTTTF